MSQGQEKKLDLLKNMALQCQYMENKTIGNSKCLQHNYVWINKIISESGEAKNVFQLTPQEDALFQSIRALHDVLSNYNCLFNSRLLELFATLSTLATLIDPKHPILF